MASGSFGLTEGDAEGTSEGDVEGVALGSADAVGITPTVDGAELGASDGHWSVHSHLSWLYAFVAS